MKKVFASILVAFAIISLNLGPVYACDKGGSSKCSKCELEAQQCKVTKLKKEMSLYWAYQDELKLSDDQLQKIADVKHAAMKQMIRESAEVKVLKVDIKTELWAPQIDADKLTPLIDAKYAAKAKLAKSMVKALADAQAVLTSDQRDKMKEIKTDRYINESGVLGAECTGKFCKFASKN